MTCTPPTGMTMLGCCGKFPPNGAVIYREYGWSVNMPVGVDMTFAEATSVYTRIRQIIMAAPPITAFPPGTNAAKYSRLHWAGYYGDPGWLDVPDFPPPIFYYDTYVPGWVLRYGGHQWMDDPSTPQRVFQANWITWSPAHDGRLCETDLSHGTSWLYTPNVRPVVIEPPTVPEVMFNWVDFGTNYFEHEIVEEHYWPARGCCQGL